MRTEGGSANFSDINKQKGTTIRDLRVIVLEQQSSRFFWGVLIVLELASFAAKQSIFFL